MTTVVNGTGTPAIDLAVAKTAAPAVGTVGSNETYTITVKNNDTVNGATGVTMTDFLPANATFVSATDTTTGTTLTPVGGVLTDSIGALAAGATDTITVVVTPTAAGSISNTGFVSGNQADNNPADNTASVTTIVNGIGTPAIDFSIAKTASPATGTVGSNETYTITVKNNDAVNGATGVTMTDFLPANATFVSATDTTTGTTLTPVAGVLTDSIGALAAGSTDTITVVVTPTAAGSITNTASVSGNQVDNNPANNTANVTTIVNGTGTPAIDLSIAKTASPAVGTVGSNETYTIAVTNNDTVNGATGVTMTDFLPANTTFVSATDTTTGTTLTPVAGVLTDSIGALAAGATDAITVVVTPTAAGTITNTASVSGNQTDNNPGNNTASVITPVLGTGTPAIDLSITKTASPAIGTVGSNETYTIVVKNNDAANGATGVTMVDVLPSNATFVSATDTTTGAVLTPVAGVLADSIGGLAAGATDTITVVVTPTAVGTITNTASVVGNQTDNNLGNNTVTVPTTIQAEADVSITKSASPDPDPVGQALTYTITVTNSGPISADNTVVSDTLPGSVTFVSASSTLGSATESGGVVTASLGSLPAGATATITIFVTPSQAGPLTNSASVTTTTPNSSGNTTFSVTSTISSATPPPPTGGTVFLEGHPGDGTDPTFVHNMYREMLGREPDPAGFTFFLDYVEHNTGDPNHVDPLRRLSMIDSFMNTPEYKARLIEVAYLNLLHRAPDPGSVPFWMDKLGNPGTDRGPGSSDEKFVVAAIAGSDEYFFIHGNNAQGWVDALYQDLLGRPADGGGLQFWMQEVARGRDRDAIVRDLLSTPEAAHKLLNSDYPAADTSIPSPGSPAGGSYALVVRFTNNVVIGRAFGSRQRGLPKSAARHVLASRANLVE